MTHEVRYGVLVIRMVGRAGVNVLMDYVMAHFDEWISHDRLLYDFRDWNVESLTAESFRDLPDAFAPIHAERRSGKAALIIQPHLEELAKMLIALYETQDLPIRLAYFFDVESAESWLAEETA